jgi:hypothetical protein
MRRDHDASSDRRAWWFWVAIAVVIVALGALIAWTVLQTRDLAVGLEPPGSILTMTIH